MKKLSSTVKGNSCFASCSRWTSGCRPLRCLLHSFSIVQTESLGSDSCSMVIAYDQLLFTIPNSAMPKKSLPTHMNFWDCISTPLLQPGQQHNHLMLVNLFQVISSHFNSGSRATAPAWALSPPGTIIFWNYKLHRSVYPFTPLNQLRYSTPICLWITQTINFHRSR